MVKEAAIEAKQDGARDMTTRSVKKVTAVGFVLFLMRNQLLNIRQDTLARFKG